MKTFLIGTAAFALLSGMPARAQLVGGGLGGGLGAQIGGIGGSVGGTVNGTIGNTRAATDAATQARLDRRRADRIAKRDAARLRTQNATSGVTGSAAFAGDGIVGTRRPGAAGNANGRIDLDAPGIRTRGTIAATHRGLRRVSRTASGVPVFVSPRLVPPAVALRRPVVASYPVYARDIYYGGGDAVFLTSGEVGGYMERQYDDLREDLRGTGATVTRRGDDLILELPADVTFAFDKADIQPRFLGTLATVARTLDTYRATDVEIGGHTDSVGSDHYNLALSERRGRSVADFLVGRAVDPSRLVVEALGESEPVASNATIAGRAANRRVEIVFHPRER